VQGIDDLGTDADLVQGVTPEADLSPFAFDRFAVADAAALASPMAIGTSGIDTHLVAARAKRANFGQYWLVLS
jgi:hypothetical protein